MCVLQSWTDHLALCTKGDNCHKTLVTSLIPRSSCHIIDSPSSVSDNVQKRRLIITLFLCQRYCWHKDKYAVLETLMIKIDFNSIELDCWGRWVFGEVGSQQKMCLFRTSWNMKLLLFWGEARRALGVPGVGIMTAFCSCVVCIRYDPRDQSWTEWL